ncbi:MAG: glycosyltransferase [Endomicrobiales bacterium]|nr:glycosyltransferase [Endomicrobiales bacterium]
MISVIMPCYNEAEILDKVYSRVSAACGKLKEDYEVLIVNDGSADNSRDILEKLNASDRK